jgi:hypothetical protein
MNAVKDQLDKLIDRYEREKKDAGKEIAVALTPHGISKALNLPMPLSNEPQVFRYRGRVIYSSLKK